MNRTAFHLCIIASAVAAWLLLLVGVVFAADFTLLPETAGRCERCIKRCEREACGSPVPSPSPTASPVPIPCEPPGRKDYAVGQERMLCFDAGLPRSFMEVSVVSMPSCGGDLQVQLQAPSGARYNAIASQPNSVLPWEAGKWFLYTKNLWGNCSPFTFTPR